MIEKHQNADCLLRRHLFSEQPVVHGLTIQQGQIEWLECNKINPSYITPALIILHLVWVCGGPELLGSWSETSSSAISVFIQRVSVGRFMRFKISLV